MPLAAARFLGDAVAIDPETHTPDADSRERDSGLPSIIYWGVGALAGLSLLTPNGPLTAASFLVLGVLLRLLWRPGEPPVLLFAVGYQWVQVTAKVFHASLLGLPVGALSISPSIEVATWLSLIGLVVLAGGMRLGVGRLAPIGDRLVRDTGGMTVVRAFLVYAAAAALAAVVVPLAWAFGPLTQILLSVAAIKWGAFFVLAYLALSRREGLVLFGLAFLFELISGVGYFSEFKTVFFVTLLAALSTRPRITGGTVAGALVGVLVLVALGSAWTVIKPGYRSVITQSSGQQGANVDRGTQLTEMADALGDLRSTDLVDGLDPLFSRLAYTDFFAQTIDFVPAVVPHERGAQWGAAVRHVLQPRLLFPDKPRLLSDSEVTMRYTGRFLASDDQGTSISIGYMGEAYVDFGPVGMFAIVLGLGMAWGRMFTFFVRRAQVPLLGLAFALTVLLNAYQFEIASIKLLGGVLMTFLVMALLFRLFEGAIGTWLGYDEAEEEDRAAPPAVDFVAEA